MARLFTLKEMKMPAFVGGFEDDEAYDAQATEVSNLEEKIELLEGKIQIGEAHADELNPILEDMAKLLGVGHDVSDSDMLRLANTRLAEAAEIYVDRTGVTWTRPTAWAWFAACRALHHKDDVIRRALQEVGGLWPDWAKKQTAILTRPLDTGADHDWDALSPEARAELLIEMSLNS